MDDCCLLYSTCPDETVAADLARTLVEAGYVTCANILPGMRSCYRWAGRIEEGREAVLLLKTTRARSEAAIAALVAAHPYDVPCAVVLPIVGGHRPYLEWLAAGP